MAHVHIIQWYNAIFRAYRKHRVGLGFPSEGNFESRRSDRRQGESRSEIRQQPLADRVRIGRRWNVANFVLLAEQLAKGGNARDDDCYHGLADNDVTSLFLIPIPISTLAHTKSQVWSTLTLSEIRITATRTIEMMITKSVREKIPIKASFCLSGILTFQSNDTGIEMTLIFQPCKTNVTQEDSLIASVITSIAQL